MAYPNKLRIEGIVDSFVADPNGSALAAFVRCKFANASTNADGTPVLQLAGATERGSVVTLQPIAAGAIGACAPLNGSGGTIQALCSGTITNGSNVYGAANGKVSASSGGGAVLLGVALCDGADGGTIVYEPNPAAA